MQNSGNASISHDNRVTIGLIIAAAILSFISALPNGPIADDLPIRDLRLASVRSWADVPPLLLQSYWGHVHTAGLYRPLTLASLAAQKLLWGDALWPSRLLSLLLHAWCTYVVVRLGQTLINERSAMVAGILFAVHPIHAEAVITLYGQSDLWATLFALVATILYFRRLSQPRGAWNYWPVALLYLFSLGFKESAILLPLTLGIIRGVTVDFAARGPARWFGRREAVVATALLVYLPLRIVALATALTPSGDAAIGASAGLFSRLTIAIVSAGTYLRLLAFPSGQTVYYGHLRDRLVAGGYFEAALLLVALAIFWRMNRPTRPWVAASAAILAINLLPVVNLVPIGVLVAERCLYLPSIGFVLLAGGLIDQARLFRRRSVFQTACIILAGCGMAASIDVTIRWHDEQSLWSYTFAEHPRSPRAGAMVVLLEIERATTPPTPEKLRAWSAILDQMERLNNDSPDVLLARAAVALESGDQAASDLFLSRAERLRPGIRKNMPARHGLGAATPPAPSPEG